MQKLKLISLGLLLLVGSMQSWAQCSGDPSVVPLNSWNCYVYAQPSATLANYKGFMSFSQLSFSTNSTDPTFANAGSFPPGSGPSGSPVYQGCTVGSTNYILNYVRQGVPSCGNYTINILDKNNPSRLYINNVMVWEYVNLAQGNDGSNYDVWSGYLDESSVLKYEILNSGGNTIGGLEFINQTTTAPIATACNSSITARKDVLGYENILAEDFNTNPNAFTYYGNASFLSNGALALTTAGGQTGTGSCTPSVTLTDFIINFDMKIPGATVANGVSFNFGNFNPATGGGEGGFSSGLSVCFRTAPIPDVVEIKWNGTIIASANQDISNGNWYETTIKVSESGKVSVIYGPSQTIVHDNVLVVGLAAANKAGWKVAFSGKTANLSPNTHGIDDVNLYALDHSEYSINGTNWQSSNLFTGLADGTYTLYIRHSDHPNCVKTRTLSVAGVMYEDFDGDGFGNPNVSSITCPSGNWVADHTDCNDQALLVYPGGTEICNSIDDNCNGLVDDNTGTIRYQDADGDGYGNPNQSALFCSLPTGYSNNNTDCNDNNASIKPLATETCNQTDDNCDGQIDNGAGSIWYQDTDGDGLGYAPASQPGSIPNQSNLVQNSVDEANYTFNFAQSFIPTTNSICGAGIKSVNGSIYNATLKLYSVLPVPGQGIPGVLLAQGSASISAATQMNLIANWSSVNVTPGNTYFLVLTTTETILDIYMSTGNSYPNGTLFSTLSNPNVYTASTTGQDLTFQVYACQPTGVLQSCNQPQGYVSNNSDCNDNNANITNNTYYLDSDGDGFGSNTTSQGCAAPAGYVSNNSDCNDNDATLNPNTVVVAPANITVCSSSQVSLISPVIPCGAIVINDAPGNYEVGVTTVTWTITKLNGNVEVVTNTVTVKGLPSVTLTSSESDNVSCQNYTVSYNTTYTYASGVASYNWYINNTINNSYAGSPNIGIITGNTPYDIYSSVTINGCTGTSAVISIQVTSPQTYFVDADNDGFGSSNTTPSPGGIDQEQPNGTDNSTAVLSGTITQSFAPTTNSICALSFQMPGYANLNVPFTLTLPIQVKLYNNLPSSGGTIIAQSVLYYNSLIASANQIPGMVYGIFPGIPVTSGQTYYMILEATIASASSAIFASSSSNGYANGMMFLGNNYTSYPNFDLRFREFSCSPSTQGFNTCNAPSGYVLSNTDCDDSNANVNPAGLEICNNIDENCNGTQNDGVQTNTYYVDSDGDGSAGTAVQNCQQLSGYFLTSTDCNDANATIHPNASEICNGVDENCNGTIDENAGLTRYQDADGDSYGNLSVTIQACDAPEGYVNNSLDCNDSNSSIKPNAIEICNQLDDDCDLTIDEGAGTTWYPDADGDGYGVSASTGLAEVVDQSNSSGSDIYFLNSGGYAIAQSFSTNSSSICGARIKIVHDTAPINIEISLYEVLPADGYSPIMIQQTTAELLTLGALDTYQALWPSIPINPGQTYYIVVTSIAGTVGIAYNFEYNPYSTGDFYDGTLSGLYTNGYGDLIFETLVCDNPSSIESCTAPAGYSSNASDCDDTNASIHPNSAELCNNLDDNCNSTIDENVVNTTYFIDSDGDGFGNPSVSQSSCTALTGYVTNNTDCNDANPALYTATNEICNLLDDDCDGEVDEGMTFVDYFADADGDGFGMGNPENLCENPGLGYATNDFDCYDFDASINPAATEVCNGSDDNCNGLPDEGLAITFYYDYDLDGFGVSTNSLSTCSPPNNHYTPSNGDCNDYDDTSFPGGIEVCDWSDNDCDGQVNEGVGSSLYADLDQDGYGNVNNSIISCFLVSGYVGNSADCNDALSSANPAGTEICGNNIDEDCSGADLACPSSNGIAGSVNIPTIGNYGAGPQSVFTVSFADASNTLENPGDGMEKWYHFTALHNAVRIALTGSNIVTDDNDISLFDNPQSSGIALIPLMVENDVTPLSMGASTDGGNEVLLFDQLTPGSTYFICIRNLNFNSGNCSLSIGYLRGSENDIMPFTNYTGVYNNACQSFKAKYRFGASSYVIHRYNDLASWNAGQTAEWIYTTTSTNGVGIASSVCQLAKVVPANLGDSPKTYFIAVDVNYTLRDAFGNLTTLTAFGQQVQPLTMNPESPLIVRSSDQCPTYKSLLSSIATNRSVCGTKSYVWELTENLPIQGLPSLVNGPSNGSRILNMSSFPSIAAGKTYNVRIQSRHVDNISVSPFGANACVRTLGAVGMAPLTENTSTLNNFSSQDVQIFPNPSDPATLQIYTRNLEGDYNVFIRNAQGKLVASSRIEATYESSMNLNIPGNLSSGVYLIEVNNGMQQFVFRWMLNK